MPDDRWDDLRAQDDRDKRKESDRRIQSLEDTRDRGRGHEGHGNGNGNKFWAGLITLALAFIIGGIVLYREMGEVKASVKANTDWIEYLKQHLPRERR